MFFNIDADEGRSISGWLAPDNPSAAPRIAIIIPGRDELLCDATIQRPDIRELGLHSTGRVGFSVDASLVPDIETVDDIELLDADTRLPLYRRFQVERHIERKFFLFDCSVMPQRGMMHELTQHFALNYVASERHALETMIVLINNHFSKSIFFAGRPNFNRYAGFLESGGYLRAAILREPLEELAERLLFLSLLAKSGASHLIPTYVTGIAPLIEFARNLPFHDPKGLLTAFRQVTDEQRQCLMSPMVRMLGCNVDELPGQRHVSFALDHLASLDIVGTRTRYDLFRSMVNQFVGASVLCDDSPASFPTVTALAQTLSRIGMIVDLLEHDLQLYAYVDQSIAAGREGQDPLAARDTQTI
jgi:hypothetical protein